MVADVVIASNAPVALGQTLHGMAREQVRTLVIAGPSSLALRSVALDAGATYVVADAYGEGRQRCIEQLTALPRSPDFVVFLRDDGPFGGEVAAALLAEVANSGADLVFARMAGAVMPGSWAVEAVARAVYRAEWIHNTGCFAARWQALVALGVVDRGDGWDGELVVRAMKSGLVMRALDCPMRADFVAPAWSRRLHRYGRAAYHFVRHVTSR